MLHDVRAARDLGSGGRVLVVEQHALLAMGLQLALSGRCWEVEATSGPTALDVVAHAQRFQPHCALVSLRVGSEVSIGAELVGPLVSTGAHVLLLTAERRRAVLAECIEAGAVGWIGTDAALDELDATVGHVIAGGSVIGRADRAALLEQLRLERAGMVHAHARLQQLTKREALVLGALIDGLSAEEIATAHFVALTTVRSQIRAVLQKLGVRSQLAAVALASAHRDLLPHEVRDGNERRRAHHRRSRRHEPALRG
jgi:two-component system, NarL family, nitrate/nitrite response regulator NarL